MEKINNVEDLMGLIKLAEKSSSAIERLKLGRHILTFLLILYPIVTFLYFFIFFTEYSNSLNKVQVLDFLDIIIFVPLFLSGLFALMKIRKQMNSEYRVLNKLYNLIDPLKSLAKKDISIMKMATIEIRLSRIDFGNYQSKKEPNRAEKQINIEKLKESLSLES